MKHTLEEARQAIALAERLQPYPLIGGTLAAIACRWVDDGAEVDPRVLLFAADEYDPTPNEPGDGPTPLGDYAYWKRKYREMLSRQEMAKWH